MSNKGLPTGTDSVCVGANNVAMNNKTGAVLTPTATATETRPYNYSVNYFIKYQ
jgi:hypothetical protein